MEQSCLNATTPEVSTNQPVMVDGVFHFGIKDKDGTVTPFQIDMVLAQTIVEQVEDSHPLPEKNGKARVTPEFISAMAAEFDRYGITNCSPSVAYMLWHATVQGFKQLKKNTSEPQNSPTGSESSPAS